jgi:ATP-dependent DNA helicase PIF1
MLSPQQEYALAQFNEGHNLMISGPGGSGKSFLIHKLYREALRRRKNIQVCALTGCASGLLLNCNSRTLHSWAGIGLAKDDNNVIINKIASQYVACKKWKNIEILIIDEVSMLSVKLFELIDGIAKRCKRNYEPFGGIQIILTGDFYQIKCIEEQGNPDTGKFCFESSLWNQVFEKKNHIILETIFRQTDPVFTEILNQVRIGKINDEGIEVLSNCINRERDPDMPICKVYPINVSVSKENNTNYNKLVGEEHIFNMKTTFDYPMDTIKQSHAIITSEINRIKQSLMCPEELKLKVGTVVMCLKNSVNDGLFNGSIGKIIAFDECPIVNFGTAGIHKIDYHTWESSEFKGICVYQLPLMLAWATTINKIQGSTLTSVEIDIGSTIFTYAQVYVALSRVKTLDGLYIKSFEPNKIMADPVVKNFYESLNS